MARREGRWHEARSRAVDAFKRTMLAAKSVALGDPAGGGPLGVYSAGLMQRLAIVEDLKAKTKLFASGTQVAELWPRAKAI